MSHGFRGVCKNNGYISIDGGDKKRCSVPTKIYPNELYPRTLLPEDHVPNLKNGDKNLERRKSLERIHNVLEQNGYKKDTQRDSNTYASIDDVSRVSIVDLDY